MVKRLLSCLALVALVGGLSAQAQVFKSSGKTMRPMQPVNGISLSGTAKVPLKITPTGDQYWWGYYEVTEELNSVGVEGKETYDCAIFIPNEGAFKDAKISAIRFLLFDGKYYANLKAWLSTTLPASTSDFDVEIDNIATPVGKSSGFNEATLQKPYTLTGKGVYVGYSVDITDITEDDAKYPIVTTNSGEAANSLYLRTSVSMSTWDDYSGAGLGKLALQVLIETPNTPKNAVSISASPEWTTIANTEQLINLSLVNKGSSGIKSFDYDVTFGDKTQSHHYGLTTPFMSINGKTDIQVPVNTPNEAGFLEPTVKITKVNGVDNGETAANSAVCPIINIPHSAPHKSVMEEFTGTWCGWCPRGIVGMANLKNKFGDKFIGIASHFSFSNTQGIDPMQTTSYLPVLQAFIQGFPSALIDRVTLIDPYFGSQDTANTYHSDADFQEILNMPAEVELGLISFWKDDNTIDLTTSVNYYYSRTDNPYRLAYVITEDSLSGTTSAWAQTNYFSGKTTYPTDLDQFTKGGSTITGLKFNHVAHDIYSAMGIENSLTGALEVGKTITHNYQIDITKFACPVQNKQNLRAIVMVINNNSGRIVNAQEVKIGSQVGLNNVLKDALSATVLNYNGMMTVNTNVNENTNVSIYKTDGSLVASKAFIGSTNILTSGLKGVYIIRVSNSKGASVRKVIL